jgi:predicted NUDIX family NTP pyrophosphohydrolase
MAKHSAGLMVYRRTTGRLEVLLVHPGGPFWADKDFGSWSIPKGEFTAEEDPLTAAKREFHEETGFVVEGDYVALGSLKQPGGKMIHAWAVAGDCDPARLRSNTFSLEWPPRSGRTRDFPEVDRAAWFPLPEAQRRIARGQVGFLDQLAAMAGTGGRASG